MNKPTEQELSGMTVNERLFALGLLDQFDEATKSKNREQMIKILGQCAMTQKQCEFTTHTILKQPEKYGF